MRFVGVFYPTALFGGATYLTVFAQEKRTFEFGRSAELHMKIRCQLGHWRWIEAESGFGYLFFSL